MKKCGCEKDVFACREHAHPAHTPTPCPDCESAKTKAMEDWEKDKPVHTPLPWKEMHDTDCSIFGSGTPLAVCRMTRLCDEDGGELFKAQREANAAFIVRAVNAHEALVEVVKEALCHLDPNCEYDGANANGKEVSEYAKLVIGMYKALAQAEGKE